MASVDGSPSLAFANLGIVCHTSIRSTILPNDVFIHLRSLSFSSHQFNLSKLGLFESKELEAEVAPDGFE